MEHDVYVEVIQTYVYATDKRSFDLASESNMYVTTDIDFINEGDNQVVIHMYMYVPKEGRNDPLYRDQMKHKMIQNYAVYIYGLTGIYYGEE